MFKIEFDNDDDALLKYIDISVMSLERVIYSFYENYFSS